MAPPLLRRPRPRFSPAWSALLLGCALLLTLIGAGRAQFIEPEIGPKTYTSPSGHYTLRVDPQDRRGEGDALYNLRRDGKTVWAERRPYTLWDARLADDGTVAGYVHEDSHAKFHVLILAPDGKPRLDAAEARHGSRFVDAPSDPRVGGLFLDPGHDRFVIRIEDPDLNRGLETWRTYRLSTGELASTFQPKLRMTDTRNVHGPHYAEPVAGTPLTLVQWWILDFKKSEGPRFTLVDPQGTPVWQLDLPHDYQVAGEEAEARLRRELEPRGAILETGQPGRFALRFVAAKQRVEFSVKPGANGHWKVAETGRQPYAPPQIPPVTLSMPERRLKHLGTLVLRNPRRVRSPIRDMRDFCPAGPGRLAVLREEGDAPAALVLVERNGRCREISLRSIPLQPETEWSGCVWLGGDRFLVTRTNHHPKGRGEGWWVDFRQKTVSAEPRFTCQPIHRLAGRGDGTFLVFGDSLYDPPAPSPLVRFDARDPRRITSRHLAAGEHDHVFFGAQDMAVTSAGLIGILGNIRGQLLVLSSAGRLLRTVSLERAWGRKPRYLAGLSAGPDGGFIVKDFEGSPPFVWTDAEGRPRGEIRPRFPDGRSLDADRILTAPDGSFWTTDGHAMLRLDRSGTVRQVLGEPPDPGHLDRLADLALGPRNQLAAADARTHAVHLFDDTGRWLRAYRPPAAVRWAGFNSATAAVRDSGDVYVGHLDDGGWLHFAADGRLLGRAPDKKDFLDESRWLFQPHSARRWAVWMREVALVEGDGREVMRTQRDPNGNWLSYVDSASEAPDGSLAVTQSGGDGISGTVLVSLYRADGSADRTLNVPVPSRSSWKVAWDGRTVILAGDEGVLALSPAGRPLWRFHPPTNSASGPVYRQPLLPKGRAELWLYDGGRTVHRYALPDAPATAPGK